MLIVNVSWCTCILDAAPGEAISVQVHMASCLLVVVDSVEGAAPAHALALALVEAALHAFLTDLAAELLRFVNPASDAEGDAFLDPQGASPPHLPQPQSIQL